MKKTLLLFFVGLLCFSVKAETIADTAFAGGSGTGDDPYQIATLAQLRYLFESNEFWSDTIILTADINAAETETWSSSNGLGRIGNNSKSFTGFFDGQGHIVDSITSSRAIGYGFFGYTSNATIQNLGLTNCKSSLDDESGGLVGTASNNTVIKNCYVTGVVNCDGANVMGGLVGYLRSSKVSSCYTDCSITEITGGNNVGGLVGIATGTAVIENCFVAGTITSGSGFAGIVAQTKSSDVYVKNCYFSGSASSSVNKFCCSNSGYIVNCFYDKTILGGTASGLTTEEFASENNFPEWNFDATWYIDSVPGIDTVKRPYLRWQFNTYHVNFSCDTSLGDVSGVLDQYLFEGDTSSSVSAIADSSDYIFMRWVDQNGNIISRKNPLSLTNISSDSIIIAIFSDTCLIEFFSTEGGSLAGNEVQYVKIDSNASAVSATADDGYYFVEWQDVEGNIISTDNPLIISNVSSDTSVYAVFAEKEEIEETSVSTENFNDLNVYPNPTTGEVNVLINGTCELFVYNIAGQSVFSITSFTGGVVDLSDLQKGMYILSIKQQDNVSLTRIIKY